MIFIRKDLDHLDAMSFLRILRNVGAPMDVVLLLEPEDTMTEEQARSIGFHSVLRKEYQAIQLCSIISDIVSKQESNLMNQNSPRIAPAPALIHPPNRDVLDRRTDPFPEPTRGDLIQDHNLNHLDTSPRGRTRGSSIPMKTNEIISSVV